ncbi:MAG TPA: FAD-dependent monooxygenase [Pseudonocardiaceae bacterium]|jgi:2-polyprenyl-6-methoxyphenol hydroxylase-like FAD-dependent oxidoreductase|nr:FAD-dependent monooxygenase [Pseudonocardiaceae bacterium]
MSCTDGLDESFDVVIVGARIAGAALAAQLARQGRSVLVVDRAGFPSDTLSTHLIQVSGVRSMQRLGVLADLERTEAPFLTRAVVIYDGIDLTTPVRADADWPPGGISVNRNLLDKILIDAAREAGAIVRTRTSLVGLRRDHAGRVTGVDLRGRTGSYTVHTRLLVGADGRNSRVSELVGARTYNVTANQRFVYWAEFTGAVEPGAAGVHHHRDGKKLTVAFQSDTGKFVVMVCPGLEDFAPFKRGLPESYDDAVATCAPLRPLLADARRVSRPIGTAYAPGYFRESAGPGWALVGDAGHFKDPTLGQGISDALRQVEHFADHLRDVALTEPVRLDRRLRDWYRWRDRDAMPMYWLGWDFARAGELGALERALIAVISADPLIRQMFVDGVLSHRVSPYQVMTPKVILRAARRLLGTGTSPARTATLIGARLAEEARRQYLLRRPRFAPLPKPSGAASAAKVRDGDAWAGDIADERTDPVRTHRS